MFGTVRAIAESVLKALGIAEWFQRRAERKEHRKAGQNEQKVADYEEDRKQSARAREIAAAVDRLSDDAVDRELRKYARKRK